MHLYKPKNIKWIHLCSDRVIICHLQLEVSFPANASDLRRVYGDLRKHFFRYKDTFINRAHVNKAVIVDNCGWIQIDKKLIPFDPNDEVFLRAVIPRWL